MAEFVPRVVGYSYQRCLWRLLACVTPPCPSIVARALLQDFEEGLIERSARIWTFRVPVETICELECAAPLR